MKTHEYKTIEVGCRNPDANLLREVFARYPREDITYEVKDDNIVIYLKQVDLAKLRGDVDTESANGNGTCESLRAALVKIEAIKSYGIRGRKRVYVGYNKERKVANRRLKEKQRTGYYYAEGNAFSQENGVLPRRHLNTIVCDDSETALKVLPDNCIDLVFTSPPYNFGLAYEATADAHYWKDYFAKLFRILDECVRVVKYGGRIVVNVQPLFSDYIPSHHIVSNHLMQQKMIWKGEILWEKNNYNCKYTAWGSWKSPSNPYLKYTWEFLEIFAKGRLKKDGESGRADISADEFKKWVVAKWSIAPERNMKAYQHPAIFPEELAFRVIKLFSFQGDIVLDPFNGVGTTTAVAHKLGRKYLGIDISKEYCRVAEQRISSSLFAPQGENAG